MRPPAVVAFSGRVRGRSQAAKTRSKSFRTRIVIEVGPHNGRFDSDMMAQRAVERINRALDYDGAPMNARVTSVKRREVTI
jgi:hypothetical protein